MDLPRKDSSYIRGISMISSIYRSVCTVLVLALVALSYSSVNSYSMSCMPTCSSTDSRFLLVVVGEGFQTLTTDTLNIRIIVPGDQTEFSLGIFDGDSEPGLMPTRHWDAGAPFEYSYNLKIDPDLDTNGPIAFTTLGTSLPDNDWADFTIPTNLAAMDADGNFVYTLTVTALNPTGPFPFVTSNSFKVRSSGLVQINEIFTFTASMQSFDVPNSDASIIYPNLDTTNGFSPEDKVGANYDGTFCFFFDVEEESLELEFWDGDADRGNFDESQTDTDDPNTANVIPPFAPLSTDVLAQGVNPPVPFDDVNPSLIADPTGFNFLIFQEGAVSYLTLFPDGQVFDNINPSGNREWEKWLISTITDDPAIADRMAPVIPAGEYQVCFEGLDINNFVSLRPLTAFRGEVIPDTTRAVPTMSEWGLIAVVAFMGIFGILAVRRKQQLS